MKYQEKSQDRIRVHATGCSLVDNLYDRVDFKSPAYRALLSSSAGDGGLSTGGLVFAEALTNFAGRNYEELVREITRREKPDSSNIGGPGIVPVIHAAQVKRSRKISYRFAGVVGRDGNGRRFRSLMKKAGFPMDDYCERSAPTPSTDVLSDPAFDNGRGERTFINRIGAAEDYGPESLPGDFFEAEILLFGGTALVPPLHDSLDELCRRGQQSGSLVMVTTVYDFRNEARTEGRPWPLVQDYRNINLLCVDREEAAKISACPDSDDAMDWFLSRGCGAVIITRGAEDVLIGCRDDSLFQMPKRRSMPTCRYAETVLEELDHSRDTTGCGDNFVGGVLDSLAHQLAERIPGARLNLEQAAACGTVAGALALTCLGGVFFEDFPGEKQQNLVRYAASYEEQLKESPQ